MTSLNHDGFTLIPNPSPGTALASLNTISLLSFDSHNSAAASACVRIRIKVSVRVRAIVRVRVRVRVRVEGCVRPVTE